MSIHNKTQKPAYSRTRDQGRTTHRQNTRPVYSMAICQVPTNLCLDTETILILLKIKKIRFNYSTMKYKHSFAQARHQNPTRYRKPSTRKEDANALPFNNTIFLLQGKTQTILREESNMRRSCHSKRKKQRPFCKMSLSYLSTLRYRNPSTPG